MQSALLIVSLRQDVFAGPKAWHEAEALPRLIPSLKGFADRIVIVETKNSTDNTVQVAKELGAEVVHIDWPKPIIGIDKNHIILFGQSTKTKKHTSVRPLETCFCHWQVLQTFRAGGSQRLFFIPAMTLSLAPVPS